MTANKLSVIKFEKITGIKKQQDFLFELLKKRKHNIEKRYENTKCKFYIFN